MVRDDILQEANYGYIKIRPFFLLDQGPRHSCKFETRAAGIKFVKTNKTFNSFPKKLNECFLVRFTQVTKRCFRYLNFEKKGVCYYTPMKQFVLDVPISFRCIFFFSH